MNKKIITIAIFLAILLFLNITSAQSQEQLLPEPGLLLASPFYFFQEIGEEIVTLFTFGDVNKTERHLYLAEKRLAEAQALTEKQAKPELIKKTLKKYQDRLEKVEKYHQKIKAKEPKPELEEKISEKLLNHQEVLLRILNKAPEQAREGIENAIEKSRQGFEQAVESVSKEKREELQQKAEKLQQRCQDSDQGKDYYQKGTVRGIGGMGMQPLNYQDQCLDNNLLKEFFCSSNGWATEEIYNCSNRCQDGACISTTTQPVTTSEISPFGIMAAFDPSTLTTISATDKIAWAGEHFRNLGAKWSRGTGEVINWGLNEPEFGKGYNWNISDGFIKKAYQNGGENYNHVITISPIRAKGANSDIPSDKEDYFSSYVEALVERYDGDGINDYDSIIKVKYWQMDNEPFPDRWENAGGTIDGYVKFAELTHNAIKKSDPNAKIILGTFQLGTTDEVNKFKEVIPKMKNKDIFDYVDTHYWSGENNYKIPVGEARSVLDSNGYSNAKMVALEFGTWAERDGRGGTEKGQAKFLIKGYAYNIAHGFSLINWNNLVEWASFGRGPGSMFNFLGLIADGVNGDPVPAGTPRLSYYTYKKMTETLEGSDWNKIETIKEEQNDAYGIFVYKFTKQGRPIYVGWFDCFDEQKCSRMKIDTQITISGISSNQVKITEAVPKYESGKEVTSYNTAFNTETKSVSGGKITITLKDKPIFVEEK